MIIEARLKRFQLEIDGKIHTFRKNFAIGVLGDDENEYFRGVTYEPVAYDKCVEIGAVVWTHKEFSENVDTWSIVKQHFDVDHRKHR